MSLTEKILGSDEESETNQGMIIEKSNVCNDLNSDIHNFSELSQELTLTTEIDSEGNEIVMESQEVVGHEEEVEMEEVITEDLDVIIDQSIKTEDQLFDVKTSKTTLVPPLRPLTIAPKPNKVPFTVKSVGGQQLLFLQGTDASQAIKLVAPQGQEINLANLISRPVTLKPTFKTMSVQGDNISLVQQKPVLMKKLTTTNQKNIPKSTLSKPTQHFMVVQKSDQLKLLQTQGNVLGMQTATKTLTLQQAHDLGLLTNTKFPQTVQSTGKQTLLVTKSPQKSIKFLPQVISPQIGVTAKTVTLNQLRTPTKILPANTNTANKAAPRIIFKTAGGNQTILPQGPILHVSAPQSLNTGQLHQINIPGRGMQYIKFVSTNPSDNVTSTTDNTVKASPITTSTSIVLSEVKAKIACSNNCKCVGCRNIEDSVEKKNVRHMTEKATNTPVYPESVVVNNKYLGPIRPRRSSNTRKQTINFITDDVIEATCQCLLTISDNADENIQDEELTKRLIIEEFGRCLTEIIDCSSNRNLS